MKKNSDIEWKEFGRPQTAFAVSSGKCWAKGDSPQWDIRFMPTLESEQKTLGRFFNPVLEVSRVTLQRKFCFLEATLLCLRFWLRVKKICWVVKIPFLVSRRSTWSKTCFCKKNVFPCFFYFERKTFNRSGNRSLRVQKKVFGFSQLKNHSLVIILGSWAKKM